ncbi:MAG: DVUA0089 family protein [Acidobacteriaceae bacterium]|nr:DVUA0089 family protein [Acidobacteriaceae bacterium]
MFLKRKLSSSLAAFAFCAVIGVRANASSISQTYSGALASETGSGSVILESFTLTSASNVTIYTTSYGGGANLDGTTAASGGFQPNITLYNSTGFVVANQSPSFSPLANTDSSTGLKLDGYLQDTDASAGTYYVTLTDWQNQMSVTSTGLSLSEAASLQFTGPGGTSFQDVDGNNRSGSYALNISAMPVGSSSVPEPATFSLVIPALAAAALFLRKRRNSAL